MDLWNCPVGFLSQTNSAIRKILVALGSQQRLLQERRSGMQQAGSLQERADLSYITAVRALRQSIAARAVDGKPVAALGCVLLILLASLRGSLKEMLIHLQSGTRIICESAERFGTSSEMRDIALLIHDYAVHSYIFCRSPMHHVTGESRSLAKDILFSLTQLSDLSEPNDLRFSVGNLTMEILQTFTTLVDDENSHSVLFPNIYRLRARNDHLQKVLDSELVQLQTDSARHDITKANILLAKLFLDAALLPGETRVVEVSKYFDEITSLISSFLDKLHSCVQPAMAENPNFSMGVCTIYMLDAAITRCPDQSIRRRALKLVDRCPSIEGMWVARDAKHAWKHIVELYDRGNSPEPDVQHVRPSDEAPRVVPREACDLLVSLNERHG